MPLSLNEDKMVLGKGSFDIKVHLTSMVKGCKRILGLGLQVFRSLGVLSQNQRQLVPHGPCVFQVSVRRFGSADHVTNEIGDG